MTNRFPRPRLSGWVVRLASIGASVLLWSAAVVGTAEAAQLTPFATQSVNCSGDGYNTYVAFPAQPSDHPSVIARLHSAGASGYLPSFAHFAPGDTVWDDAGSAPAGQSKSVTVFCFTPGAITLDLFDTPSTPVSFSGIITPGSDTRLYSLAPGAGQYVADVTINQGALDVGGTVLASNGQVQLGALGAGESSLSVNAQPGPTVTYTVSIRELPVQINGLSFGAQFAAPGGILKSPYSVTGDTVITAYVRNSSGQIVRTLATNLPVAQGSSSLTWDGRGDGGSSLPDGGYTLHLDSRDPSGNATAAETTITLDGTPPTVAMTSPATISPSQAATFAVSDALSGVHDATLTVGGQQVDSLRPGGTLQYDGSSDYSTAMGPLATGTYTWSVTATDNVGNRGTRSGTFTVRVPATRQPTGTIHSRWHSCGGQIGFQRQTENVVSDIRVLAVNCKTARSVARGSRGSRFRRDRQSYRSHGFVCRGEDGPRASPGYMGKHFVLYRCLRGSQRITFNRY